MGCVFFGDVYLGGLADSIALAKLALSSHTSNRFGVRDGGWAQPGLPILFRRSDGRVWARVWPVRLPVARKMEGV